MRAREPDVEGMVDNHGAKVAYEVYGSAGSTAPAIVFPPISSIVTSRAWKAQIPFLARHRRVVVIDAVGNGASERTVEPAAFTDAARVACTLAVMDEVGVQSGTLIGICSGGWLSLLLAASHPDRVDAVVGIAANAPHLVGTVEDELTDYPGSFTLDEAGLRAYCEYFFAGTLPEPHSSKVFEDALGWAAGTTPAIVALADSIPATVSDAAEAGAVLAAVRCPVLVIHGELDRCTTPGNGAAIVEMTGAESVEIGNAGHLTMAREPVAVNLAIGAFLDRVAPVPKPPRRSARPTSTPPRALLLSSPIGLGHARRDVSIAKALRAARPDLQIDWLAQHPLTLWLERQGERVHPASRFLASESTHIESECGEHALNAFQAIRNMDEILVANFMVFTELVEQERYDLWIGDEAWELDYFLHENPDLKRAPYAWLTDFVGWLPMPEGGAREAELTADYNADMLEQIARLPRLRDRSIFIGSPDDVVPDAFGPGLPAIRDWTERHFDFSGYVADAPDARVRARFGFGAEPVCVVAVGGSGVGTSLLRRAAQVHERLADQVPGLRTVMVAGPRIDPASVPAPSGVEVRGYEPELDRMLAACDVALVQGGLSTTMELAAAGTPFVYVPLRGHFEQNRHVRHRLERYRAGRCIEWDDASPQALADALAGQLRSAARPLPVETDGAAKAAQLLAELF